MATRIHRRGAVRSRRRSPDVRDRVGEQLQRLILTGELSPGTKLVQQRLASQLGVSQSVLREVLLELQVCGLVETAYNRGMFVSQLDAKKLIEAFEVREAHECLAARLCCGQVAPARLRELAEVAERVFTLAEAGKQDQMAALDREFHQQLVELSGNSMLVRLSQNFWVLGKILRAGRNAAIVRNEHLAILKAIGADNPERAERIVRKHIQEGKRLVQEKIRDRRFVPAWVT